MGHRAVSAVAAIAILASLGVTPSGAAAREAGVTSAVNADSRTKPPLETEQTLVVGHNVVFDERITTGELGQAQLLMLDQSAVTVGQNSELVIDKFVYDPDKRTGEMALSLSRGLMRFVGGRLSKTGNATVRTPVATMGIRGGIALINVISPTVVDVTLLYGEAIKGETTSGQPFTVRRHGYQTRLETGQPPTPPAPAGSEAVAAAMANLEGRETANAGAEETPTEQRTEQKIGAAPQQQQQVQQTNTGVNAKTKPPPENNNPAQNVQDEQTAQQEGPGGTQDQSPGGGGKDPADNIVGGGEDPPPDVFGRNAFGSAEVPTEQLGVSLFRLAGLTATTAEVGDIFLVNGDAEPLVVNGGFNPDNFTPGDQLLVISANGAAPETETLVAALDGSPLRFSNNGDEQFDNVSNPFDANDATVYQSPDTFNAGADALLQGRNINTFGDLFFFVDLTEDIFDGVNGSRISVIGGRPVPVAEIPTSGRFFFEPGGDTITASRLPFSELRQYELNPAGGADNRALNDATRKGTPIIFDFNTGKMLYVEAASDLDNPGGPVMAMQAMVGDIELGTGFIEVSGSNAGVLHIPEDGDSAHFFTSGDLGGKVLGDPAVEVGLTLFGDHDTIQHVDDNGNRPDAANTLNTEGSLSAADPGLAFGLNTAEVDNAEMLVATLFLDTDVVGENDVLISDDGSIGSLSVNRATGEMAVTVRARDTNGEIEEVTVDPNNTAFLGDGVYAIASPAAPGQPGVIAMAGELLQIPNECTCEFMLWGPWAAGDLGEVGDAANAVTHIGGFVAGTPTIDMPASGTAKYLGHTIGSITDLNGVTRDATGIVDLDVNFAAPTNQGFGTMTIGDINMDMVTSHTGANVSVELFQQTQQVGGGTGRYFGPAAANTGGVFAAQALDGRSTAGAYAAEKQQ